MNKETKYELLQKWISSKPKEVLEKLVFDMIIELEMSESVAYYPDDDDNIIPYWRNSGDTLDS